MLNLELLYDSEILLLVICPREMKKKKKKVHTKMCMWIFIAARKVKTNLINYLLVKEETK